MTSLSMLADRLPSSTRSAFSPYAKITSRVTDNFVIRCTLMVLVRVVERAGERREASGEKRVASGEWRVASGEWRVASGVGIVDQRSMPTEFAQGDHGDSSTFLLVDQRRHGQARSRQDPRPLRMIVRHTSSPEDPGELGLASAHLPRSRIWCANSWYVTSTWTSGRSTRWRSARREARGATGEGKGPITSV